jgi:imidazolonepropionase-like amidohydrolase
MPGLMDMELNLLIGGPETPTGLPLPMHGVQDDPPYRTLRATVNARKTLQAGFTTVRNLGLMVKTGGYLLDVALQRVIDQGWVEGPRIVPAGHAVTPYGGHLDPTVFQRLAPGIMPLSVNEGIANGVDQVRMCVRYQIRHGAQVIKVSASGGVMSHSTGPGSQQYSDEELAAIADEAHRCQLCARRNRLHRAWLPGFRGDVTADGRAGHFLGLHHRPDRRHGHRAGCAGAAQEGR